MINDYIYFKMTNMRQNEKIKYIEKLKYYVLKYIGRECGLSQNDYISDYDVLCMFGDVYVRDENDLMLIVKIVNMFDNGKIKLASKHFHEFINPEPNTMKEFYKKYNKINKDILYSD